MPSRSRPSLPAAQEVSTSVGDYLKRIHFLEEASSEEGAVSTGDLARSMGVAPPSATAMVRRLAREGLVVHEPYRGVRLTEVGHRTAVGIIRKHRLVETLLHEVLRLDWSEVHAEAELLEHAISDRLLERIDEFLGRPATDPHGDPIPDVDGRARHWARRPLGQCEEGEQVVIAQVTRQDSQFLRFLAENGLRPGEPLLVLERRTDSGVIRVRTAGDSPREHSLSLQVAQTLLVTEPSSG